MRFCAALLLASLVAHVPADAHPHMWVTVKAELLFDQSKAITALRYAWTFDRAFSDFAIVDSDKNQDGIYTREELAPLAEVNVVALKEFEYFTFPKVGKSMLERLPPRDYYLEYKDRLLTLYITVPLAKPVSVNKLNKFSLLIYDTSFYVDFVFATDDPVRLVGAPARCAPVVKKPVVPTVSVQSLGEAYFTNVEATAQLAARYAKTVTISCRRSQPKRRRHK